MQRVSQAPEDGIRENWKAHFVRDAQSPELNAYRKYSRNETRVSAVNFRRRNWNAPAESSFQSTSMYVSFIAETVTLSSIQSPKIPSA